MTKTKLSDILKNGEDFKVRKLDVNDPDFILMCESVKKEQEMSRNRKKVDWNRLKDIYINI